MKERAVKQAETRRRIVEATLELHREVGPALTTVSEVARRAGVGRVTVYNNFPDDTALLTACAEQWEAPPDPGAWKKVRDPDERLKAALAELYDYYRANEAMLTNVDRDAALVPALAAVIEASGASERRSAMQES